MEEYAWIGELHVYSFTILRVLYYKTESFVPVKMR